jgi:Mce-associated membrane protein
VAVLSLLLIAGLVVLGLSLTGGSASATSGGQKDAEATARTAVIDLFTTSYKDPTAFATKLKPLAAGQFLSVVTNSASGFSKILSQGKVETSGQVQQVATEKFDGTTAQVAVLAYETVKNSQTPQGSERAFRMSLSMVKSGSKWLVSNLEFVQ